MVRRPPGSTRSDTLCPDATLFLSVFMLEGYGTGMLRLDGGREATVEEVLDRMIGDTCYLLPAVVCNHAQIRSYASALATVRLVNLVAGDRDRKSTRLNSSH